MLSKLKEIESLVLTATCLILLGCSGGSGEGVGALGGPCTKGGACDPGLTCVSQVCVDLTSLARDSGMAGVPDATTAMGDGVAGVHDGIAAAADGVAQTLDGTAAAADGVAQALDGTAAAADGVDTARGADASGSKDIEAAGAEVSHDAPPGGVGSPCRTDDDCALELGCDTKAASAGDGYCTPLCTEDSDCAPRLFCPSMTLDHGDCSETGEHRGKGFCDAYEGALGPTTCSSPAKFQCDIPTAPGSTSCIMVVAGNVSGAQSVCLAGQGVPCCCHQVEMDASSDSVTCQKCAGGPDAGAVAAGAPGTTCTGDSDCKTGRCLGTDAPGKVKYCSPECGKGTDCVEFYNNGGGFNIPIETALQGSSNAWNSTSLLRGAWCTTLADRPNVGTDDGKKYCWFVCPANAAEEYDSSGKSVVGCDCLPNFKTSSGSPNTVFDCQWDSAVQCSIFKACPTSTSTDACAKDISCLVGTELDGKCWSRTSNIEACVQSKAAKCDGACLANSCVSTMLSSAGDDPCVDMCCK